MFAKVGLYHDKKLKQWRVRWFGDYNPTTGKQKRYGKTFKLQRDAEHFLDTIKADFKQGTKRDPSKETLKEYTERWLHNKIKIEGIRQGTVILYKGTLDRMYEYFGDCQLRSIDRSKAQSFLSDLQPKMSTKSSLSGWSRHRVLRQCKTIFKEAVADGAVAKNPFDGLQGAKCTTSPWYYLKLNEYLKLLTAVMPMQEKVMYALCYTAGLRETEALTLRWSDIDFEKSRVHVVNQPETLTLPPFDIKDSDERIIPIPKHTIDLLTKLQLDSDGSPYVLLTGERFLKIKTKWLQCQKTGQPWLIRYWANNIPRNFNKRVKRSGIDTVGKKLTVHVLRKCCMQNWQNYLPMNVVKNLAGHSNIETTEKFYSTVDESQLANAARMSDELLNKAGAETTDLFLTFSADLEGIKDVVSPELKC